MAGKHSDAKRIKQADNLHEKQNCAIHTSFLQLPLTVYKYIHFIKVGSSDINIFWSKPKEKKNICDGQRQGCQLQQSQPASKNVNELLYKRIKRELCSVSTHRKSSSSGDELRYCTDRRAQTQPLPNLKWPPLNRDYITLPHEESKLKLIWFSQAAARRDISVLPAHAGAPTGRALTKAAHQRNQTSWGRGHHSPCGCTGTTAGRAALAPAAAS